MYNREDKRLMIPRRSGLGYTLNFAHPISWVIILAIIGFVVGVQFLVR